MTNKVIHFEIPIDDPDRATTFYSSVLGWNFTRWGTDEYWNLDDDDPDSGAGAVGALAPREETPGVLVYVGVDDIDSILGKVTDAGGEVLLARSPIPTVGWTARFRDSEGNIVGLFQDDASVPPS